MTIATAAHALHGPASRSAEDSRGAVEIIREIDDIASPWRAFEADAVMSPYGRYDWIAAYRASLPESDRDIRVAILRDASGRIACLMPFHLRHRLGLLVAENVGEKHANANLPLMRPDFAAHVTPAEARRFLCDAARAMGADTVLVPHVPVQWGGRPNAFAAGWQASPSPAFALRLDGDAEAALLRSMSADARKKLRSKARNFEKLGPVELVESRCEAEADRILDAYYRQKAARFAELGIADPFATPAVQAFLRRAATERLPSGEAAIELYGLATNGEIVAVLGGAADRTRFSGMFLSFQAGEVERYSPGEALVVRVIHLQAERGRALFDLGIGDARYKRSICDEIEEMVDIILPVTLKGRAFALTETAWLGTKRRLKANARVMGWVKSGRRMLGALRR